MRFNLIAAVICSALLSSVGFAQPGGGSVPYPDASTMYIEDMTVSIGESFTAPLVTDQRFVNSFMSFLVCDPTQISTVSVTPSAGLESYLQNEGAVPVCDVFVFPDGANILMQFATAYDTQLYGTAIFNIEFQVTALEAGETDIEIHNLATVDDDQSATITIVGDEIPSFMRGDANRDLACNLADASKVLMHLFAGDTLDCKDAADVDDSGLINIGDAVLILSALFSGGEPLNEACQTDTTVDSMTDCLSSC